MNEQQLREELDAVYRSLSWKLTAPLRQLSAFLRQSVFRRLSPRVLMHHLGLFVVRRPSLLSRIEKLAELIPGLNLRIERFKERLTFQRIAEEEAQSQLELTMPNNTVPTLNSEARLICGELMRELKKRV